MPSKGDAIVFGQIFVYAIFVYAFGWPITIGTFVTLIILGFVIFVLYASSGVSEMSEAEKRELQRDTG